MIQFLDHVNIVVDDLAAMVAFYESALDMAVTKRATISGPWIESVTGYEKVEADVAFVQAGEGTGIEMIQYREPVGQRIAGLAEPNLKGIRHIAFRVDDLDAAVNNVRAAGGRIMSEVQQVPAYQVDFADLTKRIVYCLDPEENLLELCEFK